MEYLSCLLPGFLPSPAILELVEQILNRPPASVIKYNPGTGKSYVGRENQTWRGTRSIIFYKLAPDDPNGTAFQEASQHNGRAVVHHLGFAIDKALHAYFGQGVDPLGGNPVAVLSRTPALAGALRQMEERRIPAYLTDYVQA